MSSLLSKQSRVLVAIENGLSPHRHRAQAGGRKRKAEEEADDREQMLREKGEDEEEDP